MDEREHLAALVRSDIVHALLGCGRPCVARVAWRAPATVLGAECAEWEAVADEVRQMPIAVIPSAYHHAANRLAQGQPVKAAHRLARMCGLSLEEWAETTREEAPEHARRRAEAGL